MMVRRSRLPLAAALLVPLFMTGLAACSSTKDNAYVERPAEDIFKDANAAMEEKEYTKAAKLYDEVERQHPYSALAPKAQIAAAFAHYQAMKFDEAIVALERFTQVHPGNEQAPYAYYLRALCYYEQIADVERDQKNTKLALDALNEVVRRFPDSPYARDAKLKVDLTNDHLAGKEMEVGRYYLKQQQYQAAINRFRTVVDNYQTTSHVPEALHRLTESYLALGLVDEARQVASVLGHNYPGSEWYVDSYALLTDAKVRPEQAPQPATAAAPQPAPEAAPIAPPAEKGLLSRAWNSIF